MGIRQTTTVLLAVMVVASLVACDTGTDASSAPVDPAAVVGPDGAADGSSTTGDPPDVPDRAAATPPVGDDVADGADLRDEMADLDAAVASSDLCQVHDALGSLDVPVGDPRQLAATLDLIGTTLTASTALVPTELGQAWRVMQHRIEMARSELSKADATVADVAIIFDAPDYAEAQEVIDDWQKVTCG